jgi:hypothetical protein
MTFDVVYSFDNNVLRAASQNNPPAIRFVHFMITGRNLRPYELEQVAVREFGNQYDRVKTFTYLGKGEGCPGTDKISSSRSVSNHSNEKRYNKQ